MKTYKTTIKDIYKEIHNIEEMIDNKEDKESVLKQINELHLKIMELPFYKAFRNVILLYEKEYDTYLFANVGDKEC